MTRGDGQMGLMPASMAPSRDMESATWALDEAPKRSNKAVSGLSHTPRTRNPTLPAIFDLFPPLKLKCGSVAAGVRWDLRAK